jgi:putative transcriptional regulator
MYQELLGKLLISSPGLEDLRFQDSVIIICEYSKDVVMGLILNKPLYNFDIYQIFKKLKIENNKKIENKTTFFGGPVHLNQGFILHSNDKKYPSSVPVLDNVMITSSNEIFNDISENQSPELSKIFLGCAVWDYNQLNNEILGNSWIISNSSEEIIFDKQLGSELWKKSLVNIGIDPKKLISFSGNA